MVYTSRPKIQKELFFKLKTSLCMNDNYESKIEGLYVIFKDDVCLYVGQSKNIASRLATHLSGAYNTADKILVYIDYEENYDLTESEKWLIQYFKPIENKLIDYSEKIDIHKIFAMFYNYEKEAPLSIENNWEFRIDVGKHELLITHAELLPCLYSNDLALNRIYDVVSNIKKHKEENK